MSILLTKSRKSGSGDASRAASDVFFGLGWEVRHEKKFAENEHESILREKKNLALILSAFALAKCDSASGQKL